MNPYFKVGIAAALVAGGFGLARMLGSPDADTPTVSSRLLQRQVALPGAIHAPNRTAGERPRLLPDFGQREFHRVEPDDWSSPPAPPLLSAEEKSATDARPQPDSQPTTLPAPAAIGGFAPRARLRDEAPRPLMFEPRSRPIDSQPADRSAANSDVVPASFPPSAEAALANAERPAVEHWPINDEEDLRRSHIVVDGDSLEKLAARYLGDPKRSREIYEINRDILADAELLPIGVELAIPHRTDSPHADDRSSKSAPAADYAMASNSGGLVPVRPIPSAAELSPRAQLLSPRPVE